MATPDNPLLSIVADAIASVGDALPAQCATMEAGGMSGAVAFTSGDELSVQPAGPDGPGEARRLVASRADFPNLAPFSVVSVGGARRLVTSLNLTGDAALFVGLSAPLVDAAFHGTRAHGRPVAMTVGACAYDSGYSGPEADTDLASCVRTLELWLSQGAWLDATLPQIGERVSVFGSDFYVHAVQRVLGYFHLTVREGD